MIQILSSYDACRDFVSGFQGGPHFSDPMLATAEQREHNLHRAFAQPDRYLVLGAFRQSQMTGLFSFLVLRDERYMELLAGLSRDKDAYLEMLRFLERDYPGFQADFVFNPGNHLLKAPLEARAAAFEPEQQKMRLAAPVPRLDTTGIVPLSAPYTGQYCAIHCTDTYWTGEKVAAAQDRFRTLLALHGGRVVGYIDVTYTFEENEPFDLFVLEEYRRMGYGRKLLAKALELNHPKGMMLLVDTINTPALRLYTSMGFVKVPAQNTLTAHWPIPPSQPMP